MLIIPWQIAIMTDFSNKWVKKDDRGMSEKIKETFKPQGPLRPRVEYAINRIQLQIQKIDSMLAKMRERDAMLFRRIVEAVNKHDMDTGRMLSNELAEVRRLSKIMNNAKMALEQVHLRLSTVHDIGDLAVALAPAIGVMKSVRQGITRFMPEAEGEINEMTNTLSNLMVDTIQGGNFNLVSDVSSEEVDKILAEAAAVAEKSIASKLPSAPATEELPRF
jgi:division protein CdvB (Snf7/Vps24/ESCRT-III family)